MFTTALIGCSGYAGQETLDRVLAHPGLGVIALGSNSLAGEPPSALDLRLNGSLPAFVSNAEALASGADVLFLCLDHDEAAAIEPPADAVVIDLSGAHRLRKAALYGEWYGFAHPFPGELAEWSYALPELFPPTGRLIANPGCYATAALLALAPLADAIEPKGIVIDAKSGVSGAGREPKASSHAGFVLENLSPYRVGRHQHAPEIAQALGFPVCFVPHLLPIRRGLLATCYVRPAGESADLRGLLEDAYAASELVRVLPEGVTPELARVQHTDDAELALFEDAATGCAVVICALDNLGERGLADARATAAETGRVLGLEPEQVLVLSTGVIGAPLPLEPVLAGVRDAAAALAPDGGADAAHAIMTTDTRPKLAVARGAGFAVGGMAKGSGMIHPHLATMLAVVTTDYPLEPGEAADFLRPAVDASFNAISVDGECSTNDAVILLANGASELERTPDTDAEFAARVRKVCGELAKQIVADGEGATVLAEIAVRGAASEGEARAIAERVATSPLVKTALYGHDANWGRIAAAAGSAKFNGGFAQLDPDRLSIVIDGIPVLVEGRPSGDEPALANGHWEVALDLALGGGAARYLTTDLSYDYVKINAEYRT